MSRENVEVVRRGLEAFRRSDFEGVFAIFSPEVVVYSNPDEPGAKRRYEGWDGVLEYLSNWFSGWEDYLVEPQEFIDLGDHVVVDAREVGIAEQSGIRVAQGYSHTLKLREGKVVEWRMFGSLKQALDAVARSE